VPQIIRISSPLSCQGKRKGRRESRLQRRSAPRHLNTPGHIHPHMNTHAGSQVLCYSSCSKIKNPDHAHHSDSQRTEGIYALSNSLRQLDPTRQAYTTSVHQVCHVYAPTDLPLARHSWNLCKCAHVALSALPDSLCCAGKLPSFQTAYEQIPECTPFLQS
jgi:hypothetical protein